MAFQIWPHRCRVFLSRSWPRRTFSFIADHPTWIQHASICMGCWNRDLPANRSLTRVFNSKSSTWLFHNCNNGKSNWCNSLERRLHVTKGDFNASVFQALLTYVTRRSKADDSVNWSTTVNEARSVANYNFNLITRFFLEHSTIVKLIDIRKLQQLPSFETLISVYFRTYNYQITGLITVLFTKMFLYSSHLFPELTVKSETVSELSVVEKDIEKISLCYDLIAYAFYFHDTVTKFEKAPTSLNAKTINLLVLFGDFNLIQSLAEIRAFNRIDLFRVFANCMTKLSEGEAICLDQVSINPTLLIQDSDLKVFLTDFIQQFKDDENTSLSELTSPNPMKSPLESLLQYSYMTSGYLLANSLKSALRLANFGTKAQELAFEFGKNIGIAIKIASQLSAQLRDMHGQSTGGYFHQSYLAKFSSVHVTTMQRLVEVLTMHSLELLSRHKLDHTRLNAQSMAQLEALVRVVQEVNAFNREYLEQSK